MFLITSDKDTAYGWRDSHANAVGLPDDAYVRDVKEHPHTESYAYLVEDAESDQGWAQGAIAEAETTIGQLPRDWYLGATAPAVSVTDADEWYTTDPGVTSINGRTGDVDISDLLGDFEQGRAKLFKELIANGNPVGSVEDGQSYKEGTPFYKVLRDMLTKRDPVTYDDPTTVLSWSGKPGRTIRLEPGAAVGGTFTTTWTRNDAGDPRRFRFERGPKGPMTYDTDDDGTPGVDENKLSSGQTLNPPSFTMGTETTTAKSTVWHEKGPVKENNLGEKNTEDRIKAGKTSMRFRFLSRRKFFLGDLGSIDEPSSDEIRDLSVSRFAQRNKRYVIDIPDQTIVLTIAIPETHGELKRMFYRERQQDLAPVFQERFGRISVAGIGGVAPVPYRVYTLDNDTPLDKTTYELEFG